MKNLKIFFLIGLFFFSGGLFCMKGAGNNHKRLRAGFYKAVLRGDYLVVESMIKHLKFDPNVDLELPDENYKADPDLEGYGVILNNCDFDEDIECIDGMEFRGEDHGKEEVNKTKAFIIACQNEDLEMLNLLIEYGANIEFDQTIVDKIAKENKKDVFRFFLEQKRKECFKDVVSGLNDYMIFLELLYIRIKNWGKDTKTILEGEYEKMKKKKKEKERDFLDACKESGDYSSCRTDSNDHYFTEEIEGYIDKSKDE